MAKGTKRSRKLIMRGSFDTTFLIIVMTLLSVGLIMVFSASYAYAYSETGNSFHYITKQFLFAVVGVVLMFIISRIDYRIIRNFAYIIYGISIVLLVVVLFIPNDGARRWIQIAGTQFQPSEIAKFAVIAMFAHFISKNYAKMKKIKYGLLPFLLILLPVLGLMLMEPHLSGTILIILIAFCMLIMGGVKMSWMLFGGTMAVAGLGIIVMFTDLISYASSRIEMWLNPFIDPLDKGFQSVQSILSIGSGGLLGLGLGNSRQKFLYVPEPQNDFIFAIICEEIGFIGAIIIIGVFVALVWRGMVIATHAKDRFGTMLAAGIVLQVGIQALLNIAVVTGAIPNTGISLPFFSYGGTSLIMLLMQMGIILSISRSITLEK